MDKSVEIRNPTGDILEQPESENGVILAWRRRRLHQVDASRVSSVGNILVVFY